MSCSAQTASDTHCDNTTGVLQYGPGTRVSSLQLSGLSSRQVNVNKQVNFYRLVP